MWKVLNFWAVSSILSLRLFRRGKGQTGSSVPPEEHQPGNQRDLGGALQRVQRGSAVGLHHEGAWSQEDRQNKRCEWTQNAGQRRRSGKFKKPKLSQESLKKYPLLQRLSGQTWAFLCRHVICFMFNSLPDFCHILGVACSRHVMFTLYTRGRQTVYYAVNLKRTKRQITV